MSEHDRTWTDEATRTPLCDAAFERLRQDTAVRTVASIRHRWSWGHPYTPSLATAHDDIATLLAEVDTLNERLNQNT